MKIYISADGEGISGVVHSEEMHPEGHRYEEFRRLMTMDVNAAIEGAFQAGASEVLVNDAHWTMLNVIYEELDERADLIRGSSKKLSMMEGVQEYDGVCLIGYHPKVGHSHGVANETMAGPEMYEMRMNGEAVGELEINAAIAGHYDVPIIMASGDQYLAAEVKSHFPHVETAIVKESIHKWAAKCLSLPRAHQLIRETTARAVKGIEQFNPFKVQGPVELEIEWVSTAACYKASLVPGSYMKNARTIAYLGKDILEAWQGILACLNLGCTAFDQYYG
ncbi:MAG TPA: M55 family metallopeptidase [Pseudogracilibacillus sp.]|nr:M55 family metallopeptidase [Pseudogracilibacillus sp.]